MLYAVKLTVYVSAENEDEAVQQALPPNKITMYQVESVRMETPTSWFISELQEFDQYVAKLRKLDTATPAEWSDMEEARYRNTGRQDADDYEKAIQEFNNERGIDND